jgi:hypothetical protein
VRIAAEVFAKGNGRTVKVTVLNWGMAGKRKVSAYPLLKMCSITI